MNKLEKILSGLGNFIVKLEDFRIDKVIGSGGFGEVYHAIHLKSGTECAVKKLNFESLEGKHLKYFVREVNVLSKCNYRFLLPFLGFTNSAPFTIITKYIKNGSLFNALRNKEEYPMIDGTQLTKIAIGVSRGMKELHSLSIIHRDLKSLNILLDENYLPKICDFGVSCFSSTGKDDLKTKYIGTAHWMAPELFSTGNYTAKVDVYSFGLLLYEMVTKKTPFHKLNAAQVAVAVVMDKERPVIPKNIPNGLKRLMQRCWRDSPAERPNFPEILQLFETGQVFFEGTDLKEIELFVNNLNLTSYIDEGNPLLILKETKNENQEIDKELPDCNIKKMKFNLVPPSLLDFDQENQINDVYLNDQTNDYIDNHIEYTKFNDITELQPYFNKDEVAIAYALQMIEHFPNKKEEFIKNESYKLLPLDKNSTYSILNLLAEEIPNEISQINFNDVSLDLFGPQILRIFSILVKNVDYINNPKVFDFLLNKYDDFVSNDLGNNLIRVLFGLLCNELYGKKSQIVDLLIKSLTIEKIIKQSAKVICYINNINDCGTSEDITNSNHYSSICDTIDDGILHFLYDNKFYHEFLSILIRKSSPSFIFIKELIQLMSILKEEEETIVFELCGIAEIYANKFEEDLIWLSNVNCLPILLLLYDKIGNTIYTSQSMIFFLSKVIQEKNLRVTNLILKKIEFSAEVLMKINKTSFLEKYVDKVLEEKIYDNLQQNQILIDSLEFISAMSKITYCKEFCYLIRESQKFFDSKCATLNLAMMKTLVVLAMRPQNLKEMNDFKIIDFIKEKEFNDPEINKKKNILLVFADSPL